MRELGIPAPDFHQASLVAARWFATQCLIGAMSLADGCGRIWRIFLLWIAYHPGSAIPEDIQQIGTVSQFAEYYETPEQFSPYAGSDQMDRDVRPELERLVSDTDVEG